MHADMEPEKLEFKPMITVKLRCIEYLACAKYSAWWLSFNPHNHLGASWTISPL